jgi:hypothetical protein
MIRKMTTWLDLNIVTKFSNHDDMQANPYKYMAWILDVEQTFNMKFDNRQKIVKQHEVTNKQGYCLHMNESKD